MGSRTNPPRQRAGLPEQYTPKVAGHARGPLITEPTEIRSSEWSWRNARTYVVSWGGQNYRALRVYSGGDFIGYWAVELLGVPLEGLGDD